MAGAAGIEPALKVLETSVIPFYYAPSLHCQFYNTKLLLIQQNNSTQSYLIFIRFTGKSKTL